MDRQECLSYFVATTRSVMYHRPPNLLSFFSGFTNKIALASDHAEGN